MKISLLGVDITNNGDGVFLRAAVAEWGNEGSNGEKVNLTASSQRIEGDMIVDEISILNLYLKDASTFEGAINSDGKIKPWKDGEKPDFPDGQTSEKPDGEPPKKPDGDMAPGGDNPLPNPNDMTNT